MQYLITFLEGIVTFISPCLLPMLPIYILYFAGGDSKNSRLKVVSNSLFFVLGFTVLFVILGAFAAAVGGLLHKYQLIVNIITGAVVFFFGLHFMGVFKIGFLNRTRTMKTDIKPLGAGSSFLFGLVFAISWTPCVGAFLGSALLLASQQGSFTRGIILLLLYSLGLGIPFVLSAFLIDKLKGTFDYIKKHYKTINLICGGLLVVVGILMMTGLLSQILTRIGANI